MNYEQVKKQLAALTEDCPYLISNLSNTAALLWQEMEIINWVGFYELRGDRLILGPFQGKPACMEIPVGSGVCGTAVRENAVQRVVDVHRFPGHIACDCDSNSELVVPLYKHGTCWGVLDIDSPEVGRFQDSDSENMTSLCKIIEAFLTRCEK